MNSAAGSGPGEGVSLPADRSFVVQFRAGPTGEWAGRVEHVVSGAATRFDNTSELLAFIAQTLRERNRPTSPDLGEQT